MLMSQIDHEVHDHITVYKLCVCVCVCVCVFAAVADAIRTSLGPRGMDKMVSCATDLLGFDRCQNDRLCVDGNSLNLS